MRERILRFLVRLSLKHKVYYVWSKIYRTMFEWPWRDQSLPLFGSIGGLERALGRMRWSGDDWRMLWDAVSDSRATWGRHLKGLPAGDCDDQAIFAAICIKKMKASKFNDGFGSVSLLTVSWLDGEGKAGGHNVCAFEQDGTWHHISNWNGGKAFVGLASLNDVVRNVLDGRTCLGWALATTDLKLIKYDDGRDL